MSPKADGPDVLSLSIHLTEACNLRCRYCYVPAGRRGVLDAGKPLAWLTDILPRISGALHVHFTGGEPLLRLDDLLKIADGARRAVERRGAAVRFFLQTNGTLLTTRIAEQLATHSVEIGLSLDGPPARHDRHRLFPTGQGSSDRIDLDFFDAPARAVIPVTLVVSPDNVLSLLDSVLYLESIGFRNIIPKINMLCTWRSEDRVRYERVLVALACWYAETIASPNAILVRPLVARVAALYHCWDHTSCGAGEDIHAMAPDGVVYPCSLWWALTLRGTVPPIDEESIRIPGDGSCASQRCPAIAALMPWKVELLQWYEFVMVRAAELVLDSIRSQMRGPVPEAILSAKQATSRCVWV